MDLTRTLDGFDRRNFDQKRTPFVGMGGQWIRAMPERRCGEWCAPKCWAERQDNVYLPQGMGNRHTCPHSHPMAPVYNHDYNFPKLSISTQ